MSSIKKILEECIEITKADNLTSNTMDENKKLFEKLYENIKHVCEFNKHSENIAECKKSLHRVNKNSQLKLLIDDLSITYNTLKESNRSMKFEYYCFFCEMKEIQFTLQWTGSCYHEGYTTYINIGKYNDDDDDYKYNFEIFKENNKNGFVEICEKSFLDSYEHFNEIYKKVSIEEYSIFVRELIFIACDCCNDLDHIRNDGYDGLCEVNKYLKKYL